GLDTLDEDALAQSPTERDNCLNNHAGIGGMFERHDKTPVDLELVERQSLQVSQAGIAGTKIVDRKLDPERTQFLQPVFGRFGIVDHYTFGNLEDDPRRRDLGLRQDTAQQSYKFAVTDLDG